MGHFHVTSVEWSPQFSGKNRAKHRSPKFWLGPLSSRQSAQKIELLVPTWYLAGAWHSQLYRDQLYGYWRWLFLCCIVPRGAFWGWVGAVSKGRWLQPNSTPKAQSLLLNDWNVQGAQSRTLERAGVPGVSVARKGRKCWGHAIRPLLLVLGQLRARRGCNTPEVFPWQQAGSSAL